MCTIQNCPHHFPIKALLHIIVFFEKTRAYLSRSALSINKSSYIWFILKQLHSWLLFNFRLTRIDPWFIICYNVIYIFKHRHCISYAIVCKRIFLSFCQITWNPTRTNLFLPCTDKLSFNIFWHKKWFLTTLKIFVGVNGNHE